MRDIDALHPEFKRRLELALRRYQRLYPNEPQPFLTCTYRSPEEQDILYAQGRTKPGQVVTWVSGGYSLHQHRLAADVAFREVLYSRPELFEMLGVLAEGVGLVWGGRFSPPDMPHIQADCTARDILNGKEPRWGRIHPLDVSGSGIDRVYLDDEELGVDLINRVGNKLFLKSA